MEYTFINPNTYFITENVSPSSVLFSFAAPRASIFHIRTTSASGRISNASTKELNIVGRLEIGDLEEGLMHTAECTIETPSTHSTEVPTTLAHSGGDQHRPPQECFSVGPYSVTFKTLDRPTGRPMIHLAVVGDPHISVNRTNRRGRLFVESKLLLQDIAEKLESEQCDVLLIPGDLTDRGSSDELKEAMKSLSGFSGRKYVIPGDHDCGDKQSKKPGSFRLSELAPEGLPFFASLGPFGVLGLDTSSGRLERGQMQELARRLAEENFLLILSHYNLIENPEIIDEDACIENHKETQDLLGRSRARWIIYSGHKNIPVRLNLPRGCQVNASQPNQYPAGYMTIQVYEDTVVHQFVPIRSEALRNYSMRMLAEDKSPSFHPIYRYGKLYARSFSYSWKDGGS